MPGPDSVDVRRDGRLTSGLFWAGVGLAPIAALLLLLVPEGAPLRFAAVLAVLVIVLIGLSITLRASSDTVRADLEESLYEEIDALRNDVRHDIGTAARATHKAFGEKLQVLNQQLHGLRAQLESGQEPGGYDRAAVVGAPTGARPAIGPGPTGALPIVGAGRTMPAGGVVRHTETVQVTTRQTIVDPPLDDGHHGGTVYGGGGGYGRRGEVEDEGWSEQHGRSEGRRARSYDRDPEPDRDGRWSDVRAGDRWGSVREDESGREVRVGERRAALHSDHSGTEMRFEDRWAQVRHDEPRRDEPRRDLARGEEWRDTSYGGHRHDGGYPAHGRDEREDLVVEEARRADRWRDERGEWQEQSAGWRDQGAPQRDERGEWRDEAGGWAGAQGAGRYDESVAGWSGERRSGHEQAVGWNEDGGADWGPNGGAAWSPERDVRRDEARWNEDASASWRAEGPAGRDGNDRWAGRGEPEPTGGDWESGRRALPALPAGGQQQGIWDAEWVEPERQPVGGRRRRDEDHDYRYRPEPDDRWR